jgi:hypothetical protein
MVNMTRQKHALLHEATKTQRELTTRLLLQHGSHPRWCCSALL